MATLQEEVKSTTVEMNKKRWKGVWEGSEAIVLVRRVLFSKRLASECKLTSFKCGPKLFSQVDFSSSTLLAVVRIPASVTDELPSLFRFFHHPRCLLSFFKDSIMAVSDHPAGVPVASLLLIHSLLLTDCNGQGVTLTAAPTGQVTTFEVTFGDGQPTASVIDYLPKCKVGSGSGPFIRLEKTDGSLVWAELGSFKGYFYGINTEQEAS
ncbi:uncharacterized protein LOC135812367 [Sycon ciliatum]|uniref:uncharacterized protein LOC135812367 n=1 Tax=Sycon ciliatum TaxID=27933 RepID=UPI0031F624D8